MASKYKYKTVDGSLVWEGLIVGNLVDGSPLSWEELRAILIPSTRFAVGRHLKDRSLSEMKEDLEAFILDRGAKERKADHKQQDFEIVVNTMQAKIGELNQEVNELRRKLNEAT